MKKQRGEVLTVLVYIVAALWIVSTIRIALD